MFTQDGLSMVKKQGKEPIYIMILEWGFKVNLLMEILLMENGFSLMENFIKEPLKIINLKDKVNIS